jgi:hypothetical protein
MQAIVPIHLRRDVFTQKKRRMKARIVYSEPALLRGPSWALSILLVFLTIALAPQARSQEPPSSIVQASRNALKREAGSSKLSKIYTNDDLRAQFSSPSPAEELSPESSPQKARGGPAPQTAGCDNPDHERVEGEMQAAQEELGQLRHELNFETKVISNGDVDLKNFKPGSSGVDFGSPPLSQTEPQAPGRVQEVVLEERIRSLQEASRIACYPPKDAGIQRKIDSAERQLKLLQRQLELDQTTHYSKTDYALDIAGKAGLDAEQQEIESLQLEIERLRHELPSPNGNQSSK